MPPAFRESLLFQVPILAALLVLLWFQVAFQSFWALSASWLAFFLIVAIACFFRDPERKVPGDEKIIVAAADGRIVGVEEVDETVFGLGRCKRISIYLSVLDVHVNRMPVDGTIKKTIHKPGKFLDVRHPDCSLLNEYLAWHIETPRGPVMVRQIAGLIARRIVAWAKENQTLPRGARFGMIRFGSRTEVYLPLQCEALVKVGDRVAGASSPIARWP
jgi:phosphatidylserine decarboxylase